MHAHPQATFEQAVRNLTELGWSTRRIARHLARDYPACSQSTVWRTQNKINTGPNPVIRADAATIPQPALPADSTGPALNHAEPAPAPANHAITPAVLTIIALLVAAAATAGLIWGRYLHPAPPPQVTACIRYAPAGGITGIAAAAPGCPPGWQQITLPAAGR